MKKLTAILSLVLSLAAAATWGNEPFPAPACGLANNSPSSTAPYEVPVCQHSMPTACEVTQCQQCMPPACEMTSCEFPGVCDFGTSECSPCGNECSPCGKWCDGCHFDGCWQDCLSNRCFLKDLFCCKDVYISCDGWRRCGKCCKRGSLQSTGDLYGRYFRGPEHHGNYYFRPYNYSKVLMDRAMAECRGDDPRAPYATFIPTPEGSRLRQVSIFDTLYQQFEQQEQFELYQQSEGLDPAVSKTANARRVGQLATPLPDLEDLLKQHKALSKSN